MPVYMTHPEHGTHVAYSEVEVETCKKNGWALRPPKTEKPRKTLTVPKAKNDNRK